MVVPPRVSRRLVATIEHRVGANLPVNLANCPLTETVQCGMQVAKRRLATSAQSILAMVRHRGSFKIRTLTMRVFIYRSAVPYSRANPPRVRAHGLRSAQTVFTAHLSLADAGF